MSSNQSNNDHPLQRNVAAGMNPTNLLTGFYDTRGQRIRHVAHEGALRLPSEALALLVSDSLDGEQKKKFELPQIDSLDRPSEGAEFVVTDVWGEEVTVESAEGVSSKKLRTVARNRTESRGADRIRGGGGGEEEAKQEKKEPVSAGEAAAAALASATATSAAAPVDPSVAPVAADPVTKPPTVPAAPTVATPTVVAVVAPPVPAAAAAPAATVPAAVVAAAPVPAATPAPVTTEPVPVPAAAAASAPVTSAVVATPATSTASSSSVGKPFPLPPVLKKAPVAAASTVSAPAAALEAAAAAAAAAQSAPATASADPVPLVPPAATAAAAAVATPAPVASPAATPATTVIPAAAAAPTPAPVTSKSSVPAPATATSTPAAPVVSSSSAPASAAAATATRPVAKAPPPQVLPLAKRPDAQWVQHMPGPNDEMAVAPNQTTPKPDWFNEREASSLERTLLPEWFDGSAPHRTPEHYVKVRQAILKLSQKLATRYVTATMVRRAIPGDAGSLMRLHHFLNTYHLINEHAMNDSAPNALPPPPLPADQKRSWDEASREQLVQAVVEEARAKRAKRAQPSDDDFVPIDWVAVSQKIPDMTPAQCEEEFLALPNLQEAGEEQETTNGNGTTTTTTMTTSSHAAVLTELLNTCDPKVRQAATRAALQATDDLGQAQRAATIGLIASRAAEISRDHQETVSNVLNELVELRMKKLENRLAMLDDVEGMLEAERVALELERRDLYTSRCRHWFQGP